MLHADTTAELTVLVLFADDPKTPYSRNDPAMVDKPVAPRLKTVPGIYFLFSAKLSKTEEKLSCFDQNIVEFKRN